MNHNTTCGGLIKQLNDALAKRANNSLRADDLTMTQLEALLILDEADGGRMNMKELEHSLHVAQSTAAGIVKRLERKGFIESCCDPADKRIKIVAITEKGTGCCAAAGKNMEHEENLLLSSLTDEEKDTLIKLLSKVRNNLK